ncbi:MAG: type VI secretion system ATPase TssH [Myxococcales bacterium]|nr:type VI secretion system ATPase TssH [Myxococcales bacterium]
MVGVKRDVLYAKLNSLGYRAIEGAIVATRMRGNPRVQLAHWLYQVAEQGASDLQSIMLAYGIEPAAVAGDLVRTIEALPSGAQSVEVSGEVDQAIERGWVYGQLLYQARKVRVGHVLLGVLQHRSLRARLAEISPHLSRIDHDDLAARFTDMLEGSPETELEDRAFGEDPSVASSGEQGALPPAQLGRAEALSRFTVDMTKLAARGELDPVVGRQDVVRQMVDILMRRRQNNPILTGEAGVGKTAVVEGLALRIARGEVPPALRDVALLSLDVGLLQAGASMKGEFEQRLRQVVEEVQASPKPIILFVDEAHMLIGSGGPAGTGDTANLLKPALARGKLRTIGATTWREYKKHIEPDPALTRRFQVVQVPEPDDTSATHMLRGLSERMEQHHGVQILDEALEAAVQLSRRYLPTRRLPDKSISLLDTACARIAIGHHAVPAEIEDARAALAALEQESSSLARERAQGLDVEVRQARASERAAEWRTQLSALEERWEAERNLAQRIVKLRAGLCAGAQSEDAADQAEGTAASDARDDRWRELAAREAELAELQGQAPLVLPVVDRQAVAAVVSDWTGIPVGRMLRDHARGVIGLAETLCGRVIGQEHAMRTIARRLQVAGAGLQDPNKPIGVFLLAGPSGVGKTETALALAEAVYGGEQNLITVNMSEYQERHSVSSLKGSPRGYVGYGEGGVLTEAVRKRPYSVVLLDEIEKAHEDVHEVFFQVFDKGVLEDTTGRQVDFKNTVILLTSNVGAEECMRACAGMRADPTTLRQRLERPLRATFPAALLGRMTVIPYLPLDACMIDAIARLQLARVANRVQAQHGAALHYDADVLRLIRAHCTDAHSGARAIDRIVTDRLMPRISQELLTAVVGGTSIQDITIATDGDRFRCTFGPSA